MANASVSNESFATEGPKGYEGKKFRVAFIGCGGISRVHIEALQKMPDVEIVAGCDNRPARLKWFTEVTKSTNVFENYDEMLKAMKGQIDGVNICTPNGEHAPAALAASKAGCHVITEKPMAMTPGECQKMIDAAKKAGKKLVIGFQYRYHPSTQALVRAREAGQFGNIMFVKCQALRRRGIPNWGVFGQKELQGGGPMIDIGVHVIEMAHYVMGSPKPVAAVGNTWTYIGDKASNVASQWPHWDYKKYTVEDLAIGHIRFENGAILQIEASFAAHIEKDVWNFTLMGDKGGCSWDPCAIYTDRDDTMWTSTPAFTGQGDFPAMFFSKLRNWVDGCTKGTPLTAPGEAGIAVQKILDAVYRSAAIGGKEVKID